MKYKVEFLGHGDEVISFLYVDAGSMKEAFDKAERLYDGDDWVEMLIPREYAFNA